MTCTMISVSFHPHRPEIIMGTLLLYSFIHPFRCVKRCVQNLACVSQESRLKGEHERTRPIHFGSCNKIRNRSVLHHTCEDGAETESSDLRFKLSKLGREAAGMAGMGGMRSVRSRDGVRDLREKLSGANRGDESEDMSVDVQVPKRRITSVVQGGTRSFGIRVKTSPGAARQVVRQVALPARQVGVPQIQVAVQESKVSERSRQGRVGAAGRMLAECWQNADSRVASLIRPAGRV